jgi:hypothetical protein
MEANQVHLVSAPVFCDLQQIIHALKPRFSGQTLCDVGDGNRRNRIHDYVALIHLVTTTDFYMRTLPDTNTAFDYPEADSRTKAFGEHHMESYIDSSSSGPPEPRRPVTPATRRRSGIIADRWLP